MISSNLAQQPGTTSKYFLDPQAKPSSPPEAILYANNMAQTPPSSNTSPSDHHSHFRPVRQPRQPLYVPAALRPTDPPSRPTNIPNRPRAPDTPPGSKDNSYDSAKSNGLAAVDSVLETAISRSPETSANLDELRRGLSRAGSDCLEFNSFPQVTGPPTTAHWKPDESAFDCTICRVPFSFWFRRHHCRSCGDVVCDSDSRRKVPLDENARYNANGMMFRACNKCVDEWDVVQQLRLSRPMSPDQSREGTGQLPGGLTIPQRPSVTDPSMAHSMARSQGAMEWSTF